MKNENYCKYTYLHRKALVYYINNCKYLTNEERLELFKREKIHDMDKLTLYLFWEKKESSDYHKKHASHHFEKNALLSERNYYDFLEAVFDFECAALTKTDKPLNAYDTMKKYYPKLEEYMLPIMQKLHMDSSYCAITDEAIEYINSFSCTEEDILHEIGTYLANNKDNIYTTLGNALCSEDEYKNLLSYAQ